MNLTWHIVKKDLLRLRLPVLPWALILIGQVYVSNKLLSPLSLDLNVFFEMGMFFNVLVLIGLVVTALLTATLVLDDPLSGTTMFWVTRPITGGRLLVAKTVVAMLLFGLLPVLAWVPWWLYCSFGWHDLMQAAGLVLAVQAIAVIPAFALVALVDHIGRFLLYSLVFVCVGLATLLYVASHPEIYGEMLLSRLLIAAGVLLMCSLAALVRQYLTRHLISAAVVVIGGVALSIAVMFWSPVNLSRCWSDYRQPLAGAERIVGGIEWADMSSYKDSEGVEVETVVIHLRFTGGLEDINLTGGVADVELRWPNGTTIRQERLKLSEFNAGYGPDGYDSGYNLSYLPLRRGLGLKADEARWLHHWDPETNAKQTQLQAENKERAKRLGSFFLEPRDVQQISATLSVTMSLTPLQANRIKTEPPACSISARIGARKPKLILEMPFKDGGQMADNGARLRILGMTRFHRFERQSPAHSDWHSVTVATVTASGYSNNVYLYLVDRSHGSLSFLSRNGNVVTIPMAMNIACLPFAFPPPELWRDDKWVEVPGWQEAATVAAVTFIDVGGFDRDFHTDRLAVAKSASLESIK